MELLSKIKIDEAKVYERKKEIDEGRKLAEKVDALRQLLAAEQKNLAVFKEVTQKRVLADIDSLFRERTQLAWEIKQLYYERKKLKTELTEIALLVNNLKK